MREPINPNLYQEYQANAALQQQQQDAAMSGQAPYMLQQQQVTQAALVEQTNPAHVLKDIEMRLRGEEEKFDGTIEKVGEPLMNDIGIGRMRAILSSIINQNTILSHLEDKEISNFIIQVSDDLVDDLAENWFRYGINDKRLLDHICDIILISSYAALKRAWKQNEKNWLNRAVVENINTSPRMMPQKKEGFWSRFKL